MNRSIIRPAGSARAVMLCFLTACCFVLLGTSTALAQFDPDPIDTQRFRPHATHDGILTMEGANTRHPENGLGLGLWMHYGHHPLVIGDDDGDLVAELVGGHFAIDLTFSYAFAYWFELGAHLPMAALFAGEDNDIFPGDLALRDGTFALGDMRIVPKFNLLDDRFDGFGLALIPELRIPTHTNDFYGGARMVQFVPRVILDHRFAESGFRILGDVGATIREVTEFANVVAGHELNAALGMGYRFDQGFSPVELVVELHNDIGLSETDSEEVSLELLGAAQFYTMSDDWRFTIGAGGGLLEGYGTPNFRILGGVRWEPNFDDTDDDGIGEDDDLEAYQDPDKDDDGKVDDKYDEDGDGEVDDKYDEDGDGKVDEDQARQEMMDEYKDPDKDDDGQVDPEYDKDGDGKLDEEYDQDGDGQIDDEIAEQEAIADGRDLCPDLPEDFDGIEDDDGCPEGDRDGDGVVDLFDRCEGEAETINGFEDDDGCPDEGPAQIVVEGDQIKVLATIRFKTNSDELTDDSKPIMDQLVLVARSRQDIRKIRIEGHTDSTGSREYNLALSQDRAASVKRYMVERGIKSGRLEAVGYGPDKPIADNDSESGRAQNRRVEFVIIQE